LGGRDVPAVGFALGMERAVQVLTAKSGLAGESAGLDYFVCWMGESAKEKAFAILQKKRAEGKSADIDFLSKSLKSQLKTADRLKAKKAIILGEDELKRGVYLEKDLTSHEQKEIRI
jgi:histidyl-tRNA synthetase